MEFSGPSNNPNPRSVLTPLPRGFMAMKCVMYAALRNSKLMNLDGTLVAYLQPRFSKMCGYLQRIVICCRVVPPPRKCLCKYCFQSAITVHATANMFAKGINLQSGNKCLLSTAVGTEDEYTNSEYRYIFAD